MLLNAETASGGFLLIASTTAYAGRQIGIYRPLKIEMIRHWSDA